MDINLANENLETIGTIDAFSSFIWTDRYWEAGDFELTASPTPGFIDMMKEGRYLSIKESDHAMRLEDISIKYNARTKNLAKIKGRSLESLLNIRIVWNPTVLTGNFQDGIQKLLVENAINPSDPDRKISKLEFSPSTDSRITALTINDQFNGEYLYDIISALCYSRGIGWKITITDQGKFRFKLYSGLDRSYSQFANPYIIFSADNENLLNADYSASTRNSKSVALVAGEVGVGNVRTSVKVPDSGGGTDLLRKEIFVDAQGVSRRTSTGTLTDAEYLDQLRQKGLEALSKNTTEETFEGQVDTTKQYTPGVDFDLGDIVEVADQFGHEGTSRITELIHSEDSSGKKFYPTFVSM